MATELDIVGQIKSYWNAGATGALFLKLSNGKLLQLFFVDGELQSIKYHGVTGMDVIRQIPGLTALKSQFHEGAVSRIVNELPATADIINMINDSTFSGVEMNQNAHYVVDPQQQIVIEDIFTRYVGPIADVIFTEEVNVAKSVEQLIDRLSDQLDDGGEQVRFRQEVESALKSA